MGVAAFLLLHGVLNEVEVVCKHDVSLWRGEFSLRAFPLNQRNF